MPGQCGGLLQPDSVESGIDDVVGPGSRAVRGSQVDCRRHEQPDRNLGPENYTREVVVEHLQRYAFYGVAAVLSAGTDVGPLAFEVRKERPQDAARLLTAGRGMAAPDGGPGIPSIANTSFPISSAEEGRKRVQELAAQGADAVKIWVDDRNRRVKKLTPDIYRPIIDEAHKHGMMAVAHVYYLNLGRNTTREPAEFNVDLALARRFNLVGRPGLTLRAEAFNLLIRVNLNGPNTSLSVIVDPRTGAPVWNSPSFGLITSAKSARFMQLVARVDF